MSFWSLLATSDLRARPQSLLRPCSSWAYLTQHLPLPRFLTSSGVYFPQLFATIFQAAATHRVFYLRSFSHVGSRDRLRSVTLLTLQDNGLFDGAWIYRSKFDTIQHLTVSLRWGLKLRVFFSPDKSLVKNHPFAFLAVSSTSSHRDSG
jgi:hypothetical protein